MGSDSGLIRAGSLLSWPAERYPNKVAIQYEGQEITYRQIDERMNRLANGLIGLGLKKGDRVGAILYNSPRAVEVRFALMKAGLCLVPINIRQSWEENAYIINHSESNLLILDGDYLATWKKMEESCPGIRRVIVAGDAPRGFLAYEKVIQGSDPAEPEVMVGLDDLERIAYTSGTTGRPKGIMKTIGNDLARLRNDFLNQDCLINETDIMLNVAPLTHAARVPFLKFYLKGACNIILRRFQEEEVLQTIQRERVTAAMFVPTMIVRLVLFPRVRDYDTSSLRQITFGQAPIPVERFRQAIEIFGNILRQTYGLSEATQPVFFLTPADIALEGDEKKLKRLASAGRPALGMEVRIVNEKGEKVPPSDIGEILIRGENVMKGYWKDPQATAEVLKDGWLYTGDLARMDEDGFVYIVDRKKEMIISGGFNIYPREVEQAIESHPGVKEVAVIGVPDPVWGEAVKALIVAKPGVMISADEIIDRCRERIASYKKPKSIEFVSDLPKNFQGKILKRSLREEHWKNFARKI